MMESRFFTESGDESWQFLNNSNIAANYFLMGIFAHSLRIHAPQKIYLQTSQINSLRFTVVNFEEKKTFFKLLRLWLCAR